MVYGVTLGLTVLLAMILEQVSLFRETQSWPRLTQHRHRRPSKKSMILFSAQYGSSPFRLR
jgi:hypothetical protein